MDDLGVLLFQETAIYIYIITKVGGVYIPTCNCGGITLKVFNDINLWYPSNIGYFKTRILPNTFSDYQNKLEVSYYLELTSKSSKIEHILVLKPLVLVIPPFEESPFILGMCNVLGFFHGSFFGIWGWVAGQNLWKGAIFGAGTLG